MAVAVVSGVLAGRPEVQKRQHLALKKFTHGIRNSNFSLWHNAVSSRQEAEGITIIVAHTAICHSLAVHYVITLRLNLP